MWVLIVPSLPWFIIGTIGYSLIWYDTHTIRVLIATIMHTLCVYVIKETIRVDRLIDSHGIGHSLPSLHASLVAFLASYYIYLFTETDWDFEVKTYRILMTTIYAILVCASRIILEYNTALDVGTGILTGLTCSIVFVLYQRRYTIETKYE